MTLDNCIFPFPIKAPTENPYFHALQQESKQQVEGGPIWSVWKILALRKGLWTHRALLLLFGRSVVSDSLRPHGLQHTRLPGPSLISRSSLKLTSMESMLPSSHLILCHPLILLSSVFPSIRVFSSESTGLKSQIQD